MATWFCFFTGLIAGAGHVFAGPDHLAAVAPLAAERRRGTWQLGLLWGLGHSGGVWTLAMLAMLFRELLPLDLISSWSERLVGFVLIGLGLLGLRRLFITRVHSHVHEHDSMRHVHVHVHADKVGRNHPAAHRHAHTALGIGTLHGLAGTSHLVGVLPALLLPTRLAALVYVAAFGLGAIAGMTAFSWVCGRVAGRLERYGSGAYRSLAASSCAAAIVIGAYWCFQTLPSLGSQP